MTLLSVPQYAARHGVSKVAAYKWRERGWLIFDGKLVDVEKSDERLAQYRDPSDARADRKSKAALQDDEARALAAILATQNAAPPPPVPPVGPEAFRAAVEHAEAGDNTPEESAERVAALLAGNASTEEARRVKENYLALRGRLDYQQAAGRLIEVEAAETVLFEEARAVRNAWLNFPAKYAAIIAADLGLDADRVTEVLTGYVHKQVNSLGDPGFDFRR